MLHPPAEGKYSYKSAQEGTASQRAFKKWANNNAKWDAELPNDQGTGITKFLWKEEIPHLYKMIIRQQEEERRIIEMENHNYDTPPTIILSRAKHWKIGFWNTKGASHISAREKLYS